MGDEPLTNAAVERVRLSYSSPVAAPDDAGRLVTDDYRFEDRRSGGFNFGHHDASGVEAFNASAHDVARGQLQVSMIEVIAVRGDRSAAYVEEADYGDDTTTGSIVCVRLDARLRRAERVVLLDLDDRAAAIAELDRMHAEIDD